MEKDKQGQLAFNENVFLSDAPITSEADDVLGRKKFACALSKNILRYKDQNTIVIGLYGKWGCGKSSIINILLGDIKKAKELPENQKPIIIEFNPWNFSEQDNLTSVFFKEIANNLKLVDHSKNAEDISEKLKLYGYFFSSAVLISNALRVIIPAFIFVLGLFVFGIAFFKLYLIAWIAGALCIGLSVVMTFSKRLLSSISDLLLQYSRLKEKTLKQLKDEINTLILERKKKFLIIIDDIDRLNTKEIKQIFQLVKLNADFNNTIYLLAFDREVVEKNLEEQKGVSGKEYLEKIVQVNFDVPLVQQQRLRAYLLNQLDLIIKPVPEKYWDATSWGNLFHSGFKDFFLSLRDVKRYINSLKFNFSLIHHKDSIELNPVDFIALEAVRVFAPGVYDAMRGESRLLTETNDGSTRHDDEQERKQHVDVIINKADERLRESVKEIMLHLFPQIRRLYSKTEGHYGSSWQEKWRAELRICSSDLFDRYFILDVPEGELSQYEIDSLIDATSDQQAFAMLLAEHLDKGAIGKVLLRLTDYTGSFNLDYTQNIIIPLIDISDRLPEEIVGFLGTGMDMQIMRIIYHYLKRIEDKAKRSNSLKEAIKNSKGLFACVEKVSIEIQGIEKNSGNERLIAESEVQEFKNLCLDKIRRFAREEQLNKHRKFGYIIYDWIRWGGKEEVQKYISEIALTEDGLISIIKAFLAQSQSMGMGDRVPKLKWRILYKNLKDFVDLDKAKERLEKVDVSKLSEREKLAVEVFLKYFVNKDRADSFDDED